MTNSRSNSALDGNGNLRITPRRDGSGNWTSARLETGRSDFQPPPGGKLRVEARIQMPNVTGAGAAGYWPAFWMLGAPFRGNYWNWPGVGELDMHRDVACNNLPDIGSHDADVSDQKVVAHFFRRFSRCGSRPPSRTICIR